ncbi:MAG: ATPase/DNA packaging protein [bacterium]
MLTLPYNPYKDIITVIGDNGSGKTTLVGTLFTHKENCFVINCSGQAIWNKYINPDNIIVPVVYTNTWLEKTLLTIASKYNKKATILIDDIDNFQVKGSQVFKSLTINARHLNFGIIAISRTLSDIPKIFYRQSRYLFIATQTSDYDIYYIATIIGYENAKALKTLPKYVFALWDRDNKRLTKIKLNI